MHNKQDCNIFTCCYAGDLERVQDYIEHDKKCLQEVDEDGRLPIHHAVSGNALGVVNLLLENGSSVDVGDDSEWNVYHIAASIGNLNILESLVSHDSSLLNDKNKTGQVPLHYAASKNHEKSGASPRISDNQGQTPLHRAASLGHAGIVEILLENDAAIDKQDAQGDSPLHLAIEENQETVIKMLVGYGANVNLENGRLATPMSMASPRIKKLMSQQMNG